MEDLPKMTTANILRLTQLGEQAVNNADAGGLQVKPAFAKIGNFAGEPPAEVPTQLIGSELHSGNIHYIQVISAASTRFTFEIPAEVEGQIGECLVYLEDGTPLAHATINPQREKVKGKALRIDLILMLSNKNSHAIDITLSEFGSIPTVASLRALPSPVNSMESAVGVLDLQLNTDGSRSPSVAIRYGAGSQMWGFVGWDKIYTGEIGNSNVISNGEFRVPTLIQESLPNGELIVQVVSGGAAGESRKAVYDGASIQIQEAAFSTLKGSETINIWIPDAKGESVSTLPPREGIPRDWVLIRGDKSPRWAKPTNQSGQNGTKLYIPPSRLKINPIIFDGLGVETYELGVIPQSSNYVMCSISGITQHRSALAITGSQLTFAEEITDELTVLARAFTKEPSSGDYMKIKTEHYSGDGKKTRFKLPQPVENVNDVIIYVEKMDQNFSSYSVDINTMEIVFTAPPSAGYAIEVNAIAYEKVAGYSTTIQTFTYKISESTNILELPFEPESVDMCFVSIQGIHVHKNRLTLAKNKLAIAETIQSDLEVEVLIFNNVLALGSPNSDLDGVVTGMIRTCKGMEILMHNRPSQTIPLPKIEILGDADIEVIEDYPSFKIQLKSNANKQKRSGTTIDAQTVYQGQENVIEVTYPVKIDLMEMDLHINATANFSAEVGPGFMPNNDSEQLQCILGISTPNAKEPSFDSRSRGSVNAGLICLGKDSQSEAMAYGNASRSLDIIVKSENHPSGYVTLIAKSRLANLDADAYETYMGVELSYSIKVV